MTYKFNHLKILVIEDNKPVLDLAKSILLTFGVGNVISARDGQEGFEIYCAQEPDIVISDWMMKPMDGISLTRLIRSDPRSPNHYVPIILMTGVNERGKVVKARDAGVTEFLLKPFNARELYRRIEQVIEAPRQFIKTDKFFGPDRRRARKDIYQGEKRRHTDVADDPFRREIDLENELKIKEPEVKADKE